MPSDFERDMLVRILQAQREHVSLVVDNVRLTKALTGLLNHMCQTCDAEELDTAGNIVHNGVQVDGVWVPSTRFHAAWLQAVEAIDPSDGPNKGDRCQNYMNSYR